MRRGNIILIILFFFLFRSRVRAPEIKILGTRHMRLSQTERFKGNEIKEEKGREGKGKKRTNED